MTGVKSDVAVKIFGEDLDVLFEKAGKAASIIEKINGAGDVRVEQITGLPQLVVRYKRDRIAQYGLNISEINSTVRTAFAGESAGLVFEGERRFDLVVRLDKEFRQSIEALGNLRVNRPDEELILLSQVADIEVISGPMLISREETRRRASIGINVRNRDVESFINEVNSELEKNLVLPPGYYISYGGQFENLKSAKQTSAIAVPVALVAIFILLFFAFYSFRQSVMIFTAIPLAAVGGIWALLIRGMPFSISAGVGFIALFGIAVLNGIVLISHYNQLEKEGVSDLMERVLKGTADRLRPVIMTSLVAALGFLPMAISSAAGAEVQKPLATVVIGGILTSSFLTLVVLPILYLSFNAGLTCFIHDRFRSRRKPPAPPLGPGTLAVVFLMLISVPVAMKGQDTTKPAVLTMEDAVQTAIRNSTEYQTFELQKQVQRKLIKSAFNLDSPVLSLETGQINSSLDDYKLLISQNFEFPAVYIEQVEAQKAKSRSTELLVEWKKQEMVAGVRAVYMKWWITAARSALLKRHDSLFRKFGEALLKQRELGDADRMTLLMAETRLARIENLLQKTEADRDIYGNELAVMIHAAGPVTVPAGVPDRLSPCLPAHLIRRSHHSPATSNKKSGIPKQVFARNPGNWRLHSVLAGSHKASMRSAPIPAGNTGSRFRFGCGLRSAGYRQRNSTATLPGTTWRTRCTIWGQNIISSGGNMKQPR
jgi:cobalt-zinc-cadmium resistance protein CzcA